MTALHTLLPWCCSLWRGRSPLRSWLRRRSWRCIARICRSWSGRRKRYRDGGSIRRLSPRSADRDLHTGSRRVIRIYSRWCNRSSKPAVTLVTIYRNVLWSQQCHIPVRINRTHGLSGRSSGNALGDGALCTMYSATSCSRVRKPDR